MKRSILRLISVFVFILFIFHYETYADSVTATPTTNKIIFEKDGVTKEISDINIYSINNNNYFMLRDIGYLMDINISAPSFFGTIEINLFEAYEGKKPTIKNTNEKNTVILGIPDITKLDLNDVAKQYIYNLDMQYLIEYYNVKYKFN